MRSTKLLCILLLLGCGTATTAPDKLAKQPNLAIGAVPVADFTATCVQTTCQLTDLSTDSDGSIVAWSWGFPGGTSTLASPTFRYPSGEFNGTQWQTILTVTDNDGNQTTVIKYISVQPQIIAGISLSKFHGDIVVNYTWTGTDAGIESMKLILYANDYSSSLSVIVPNTGSGSLTTSFKGKLDPSQAVVCQNRPVGPEYQCSNTISIR